MDDAKLKRTEELMNSLALGIATPEQQEQAVLRIVEATYIMDKTGIMEMASENPAFRVIFGLAAASALRVLSAMRESLKKSLN
jgi:predicted Ser/Thr protein kinase